MKDTHLNIINNRPKNRKERRNKNIYPNNNKEVMRKFLNGKKK